MNILYLILGVITGIFGGFLGIGGATIVVPSLVLLMGFTQHEAQGTILAAMIPPIGLLAAIRYYHAGHVKIVPALLIALGFFLGGYVGARFVEFVPDAALKKIFGAFLLFVAAQMFLSK